MTASKLMFTSESVSEGHPDKLCDQISEKPGTLPVPESHLRLAEERLKRYREDPSRARSAFEVLDGFDHTSSVDPSQSEATFTDKHASIGLSCRVLFSAKV